MTVFMALPGNEPLAGKLAELTGGVCGQLEMRRFPDEETYIRIGSEVAGQDVELVATLARPDPQLPGLLFSARTLRELGARSVGLIAPYLAYMRQDKRFAEGESVSSIHFARLLSDAFDRLVTIDPHLHRISDLGEVFSIPARALRAAPLLADWIRAHVERPLVVGPDSESRQWVADVAERAGAPYLVLSKTRFGDRDVRVSAPGLSDWSGCKPVLVDDIVSSGNTLIRAAAHFETEGFDRPICLVVHGIFAEDSYQRLMQVSDQVISTTSVNHASAHISIAELIAAALTRAPA